MGVVSEFGSQSTLSPGRQSQRPELSRTDLGVDTKGACAPSNAVPRLRWRGLRPATYAQFGTVDGESGAEVAGARASGECEAYT